MTFLQRRLVDGDEFLDRIITGDEIRVAYVTPETKQHSMHRRHNGSPCKTKIQADFGLSGRKVMCTVFWDRRGILLVDFLTRGKAINSEQYCQTLQKLRWSIHKTRRGMLSADDVLLHDNACPHTRLDGQYISCSSSTGRCLIIHSIAQSSRPVISIFSYSSRNFDR